MGTDHPHPRAARAQRRRRRRRRRPSTPSSSASSPPRPAPATPTSPSTTRRSSSCCSRTRGRAGPSTTSASSWPSVDAVDAEQTRLAADRASPRSTSAAPPAATPSRTSSGCEGSPDGERWEIYTVLADSPTFSVGPDAAACCGGRAPMVRTSPSRPAWPAHRQDAETPSARCERDASRRGFAAHLHSLLARRDAGAGPACHGERRRRRSRPAQAGRDADLAPVRPPPREARARRAVDHRCLDARVRAAPPRASSGRAAPRRRRP